MPALLTLIGFIIPGLCFAAEIAPKQKTVSGIVTQAYQNILVVKTSSAANYTAQTWQAKLIKKYGAEMKFGEILVGDKIEIKGLVWPDNSINAELVRNMSLYPHSGTFSGKVDSVSLNGLGFKLQTASYGLLNVQGDVFTIYKKNNTSSRLSDLEPGVSVSVKGLWERDKTNIFAKQVLVTVRLVNIEISGTVSMTMPGGISVVANGGVIYGVDISGAAFQNKNGNKISAAELKVGQQVKVKGKHISGKSQIFASGVKNMSVPN